MSKMLLTYSYFLGLRTLTVIRDAEVMIQKQHPDFSMDAISYEDSAVFDMLNRGETQGVFQMESAGMTQAFVNLRGRSVEDIIAIISLYRPGPMESIPTYIANRHHPDQVKYKIPQLEHILNVTNGCIVYQEQVMQICRDLAGFSYGQADLVRRAMSKKKHEVMEQERQHFIFGSTEPGRECPGCLANGIPREAAEQIYDEMLSFASYAFNKAHAAAYAVVAYQTAYLKCHYPKEFMAALLTSVLDNTSKIIEYTGECHRMGIGLFAPDINESELGFTVQGDKIRFGLLALKNVGRALIEAVIEERKTGGKYKNLYNFCKRTHGMEMNRRALESMIKSGAFDCIEAKRRAMMQALEHILKSVEADAKKNLDGQLDLFAAFSQTQAEEETSFEDYQIPDCTEYPAEVLLQQEKEVSGLYLSGHPLDRYRDTMAQMRSTPIAMLNAEDAHEYDNQEVTLFCTIVKMKTMSTRSGGTMAFLTVEDLTGSMEVLVFSGVLQRFGECVRDNAVAIIKGRFSFRENEGGKVVAEQIFDADQYLQTQGKDEGNKNPKNKLWLKLPSMKSEIFDDVRNLLSIFEGDMPVYFYFEDTGKKGCAPRNMWCVPSEILYSELERVLGKGNVIVQ